MIVTLAGANTFLLHTELDSLVAHFIAQYTDMAVERFDGEEVAPERMRESIQSLPFLSARKMVILREPSKQKPFAEAIADVLSDIPETTDLIILEPKIDKRLAYYKVLKKLSDFKDFPELDPAGLARWAVTHASSKGATLRSPDAIFLVDRVAANQQSLRHEIDKLALFSSEINKKNIELLTDYLPQSTVFELLDAAFAGNTKRAMELYAEQRSLKVEPQAILAMLAWQMYILVVVKAGGGRPAADIAKEAKINPYVVRKSQGLVRKHSIDALRNLVHSLLLLDVRLKRESIDADEATQLYILNLAA